MATIYTRKRKDGTAAHTVRIRIKAGGVIVYEEAKTFPAAEHKLRDVQKWASRREAELQAPEARLRAQAGHITVGQAIARYEREYGREDAWGRSKRADLARLRHADIARLPVVHLTAAHLIDHVRSRRAAGAGSATAGNDLIWLRVLLKVARAAWGVPAPVTAVDDAVLHCRSQRLIERAQQRERRPTLEELDRLLDWFTRGDGRARIPMAEIVLFALFSARRETEICLLRREDYDPERRVILVRSMKDPRQKRSARLSLTPEAAVVLERQPAGGDLFFPYEPKSVGARFTRACTMLGIEDLHFHDLRHEAATRLFELGWTVPQVASVTGHRTWQNLQRYTHLAGPVARDKYAGWSWKPVCSAPDG
jgi:integrase